MRPAAPPVPQKPSSKFVSGSTVGIPRGKRLFAIAMGAGLSQGRLNNYLGSIGVERCEEVPVYQVRKSLHLGGWPMSAVAFTFDPETHIYTVPGAMPRNSGCDLLGRPQLTIPGYRWPTSNMPAGEELSSQGDPLSRRRETLILKMWMERSGHVSSVT